MDDGVVLLHAARATFRNEQETEKLGEISGERNGGKGSSKTELVANYEI
jgi:hypothetical protein